MNYGYNFFCPSKCQKIIFYLSPLQSPKYFDNVNLDVDYHNPGKLISCVSMRIIKSKWLRCECVITLERGVYKSSKVKTTQIRL